MTRRMRAAWAFAVLLAMAAGCRNAGERVDSGPAIDEPLPGLLYGRVITDDGEVFEGSLRWGGGEEALWGHYFNGFKSDNPWAVYVPKKELPEGRRSFKALGFEIAWEGRIDLGRPFMVRFGDLTRIEPRGREIRVTLKSGTMVDLDRFEADDLADGLRIWDRELGTVDLGEWGIRTIELMAGPLPDPDVSPLHGTVTTAQGGFTGLVQWDREGALGSDALMGDSGGSPVVLDFDIIRAIEAHAGGGAAVTLSDGRELVLTGTRQVDAGNRGVYVDDVRYGRVLVSWDAFERVDFTTGATAPGYDDFPASRPLEGSVTTRSGRRLEGRLVYDLDESDTAETLDAPWQGVDYTIPFRLIEAIAPGDDAGKGGVVVTLRSGEVLHLERSGDLGEGNAGVLIFVDGRTGAEYVPWPDVERIELH